MTETRGPLWTRQGAAKPERLTRETVVACAVELADREGLDAVSVRRVAAELSARPMSLYSFFQRKDDLVDLMIDHVLGEMLIDELPSGDWREALRAVLHRQITVGRKHLWVMRVFGTRAPIGPNAARHAEQSLAAVAGLDLPPQRAVKLLKAVDTYLWGFVTLAGQELAARRRDELTEQEWQASTDAYFTELVADGDLPHLAAAGRPALLRGGIDEWIAEFDEGLTWLLDGFAAGRTPPGGSPG
ncbi:TetR/AcrR family transcriptional regulator [Actinoplanes sp. N902-109]|uniref:TetR/AcrR family transcriptional regulator n=1 Tax=Actinoplanes sp. (strain N902-109) TaxID=649831 RepID=UPI0003293F91|nr:TetR/AcrR family transcriptional regulator C-terminal domain-containing protein [Actinoplanes sp. N902-109]AGL15452.1 TetR family transcriptional regulator [Actinoplanes sp. N902-109]